MANSGSRTLRTLFTIASFTLVAAAFLQAPASQAQTAKKVDCNGCIMSKQIKDNSIKGKDLKPGFAVGTRNNDGDVHIKNTAGTYTISLDGQSGTVTNSLSGNGVVKAWARINADGTVSKCYRCNKDPAETQRLSEGKYEVDFTPLGTDITQRPRTATVDGRGFPISASVAVADSNGIVVGTFDTSSVLVITSNFWYGFGSGTSFVDAPFTVVIY